MPIENDNNKNETEKSSQNENERRPNLGLGMGINSLSNLMIQQRARLLRQPEITFEEPIEFVLDVGLTFDVDVLNRRPADVILIGNSGTKKNNPYNTKIKKQIFKSNPTWNKMFNHILEYSKNINESEYWDKSIQFLKKHMNIINKSVQPKEYMNLLSYRTTVDELFLIDFYEDIEEVVIDHKVSKFIKNNFKNKLIELINDDVKDVLRKCFKNNIKESILRKDITSRIYTIKDANDLLERINSTYSKEKNWNKKYYLELAKKHNVKILKNLKNSLVLEVDDYEKSCLFTPNTWCIKTSQRSFDNYVNYNTRQIVEMNFKYHIDSRSSIKGITLNLEGEILSAHDYQNEDIKRFIENPQKYKKYKISDKEYLKRISQEDNISKIYNKVTKERAYLLAGIFRTKKKIIKKHSVDYFNPITSVFESNSRKEKDNTTEYMMFKNNYRLEMLQEAGFNVEMLFQYHNLLPRLLVSSNYDAIKVYLDIVKNKIDLYKLVLSTNNKYVSKKMQKIVFDWVNEHQKGLKNAKTR